jgi:hypothetical protein
MIKNSTTQKFFEKMVKLDLLEDKFLVFVMVQVIQFNMKQLTNHY